MPKEKKHIHRVGDIVKIINPALVERVGYPWTKEYVKNHVITTEQKQAVIELMKTFGVKTEVPGFVLEPVYQEEHPTYYKILDALAFEVLKRQGYGGKERSIHTIIHEKFRDSLAMITKKRIVKTGTYVHGSAYTSYYGESDYEPPYLADEKSHVILRLDVFAEDSLVLHQRVPDFIGSGEIEIEECNVEAIELTELQEKNRQVILSCYE